MTDIGKKQRKIRVEPQPKRVPTKAPSPARTLPERVRPPRRKAPEPTET